MADGDAAAAAGLPVVAGTADKRVGFADINRLADKVALHMTDGKHGADKITGQIATAQIADSAVTSAKIADKTIGSSDIKDGGIATGNIASLAVTTPKLADKAVTSAKVDDRLAKVGSLTIAGVPARLESSGNPAANYVEVAGVEGVTVHAVPRVVIRGGAASLVVGETSEGDRVSSESIRSNTTSSSANVFIDPTSGILRRVASSSRYKRSITDAPAMPRVLNLRPRTWEARTAPEDDHRRYFGLIAEEVHGLGLSSLVSYDENGQPEAVAYDRIVVALIPIIRSLIDRVVELETPGPHPAPTDPGEEP